MPDTILNVRGGARLFEACHQCYASLWTDRAISYRTAKGLDHFDVALSIGIQPMVRSDIVIGICGEAPSDYPEFAEVLVKRGISSISLNPDTVIQTTHHILETEKALKLKASV